MTEREPIVRPSGLLPEQVAQYEREAAAADHNSTVGQVSISRCVETQR